MTPLLAKPLLAKHATCRTVTALLTAGGLGISVQSGAIAQVTINRDANTGAVRVNQNSYTLETGRLTNSSNIPLPALLPTDTDFGEPIRITDDGRLAPNSIILGTDLDYIRNNFTNTVNGNSPGPTYQLQEGTISITTSLDLRRRPGQHAYGEGIRVRVLDANNNVIPGAVVTDGNGQIINRVFIRGDDVTVGPNGQRLNSEEVLFVTYGEGESVEIQLLNIRENNAAESESGAYFSSDGRVIVEDLENGGDRDFDDGDYFNLRVGSGEAIALEEDTALSFTTRTEETPLEPETRRESIVAEEVVETVIEASEDIVTEDRTWGSVEIVGDHTTRLGHATGARTEDGKQLVYDRYASTAQLQAGSDGISAAGQFAPINNAPSAPPTLFTGRLAFNPWVDDGQAGFTASAGVTQFLSRTHRPAQDALGNPITNPNPAGPRLIEPAGLLSNRRFVGYVPAREDKTMLGEQLTSTDGVFNLPADRDIVISPPNPDSVGPGNAAYTDNVGGLIIEQTNGDRVFVPQWTKEGHETSPIALEAGEAARIIYALVPQQPGQQLRLGQRYEVTSRASGDRIANGNFLIISADRQPQNFLRETAEIYAVEDTVPAGNAVTELFNGMQGMYIEAPGEGLTPTVDLNLSDQADARVGNTLYPVLMREGNPGQSAYARTTRAAGLYLGGSLTGGIGNQRDVINQQTTTLETATDQRRIEQAINTFLTPITQVSEITVETIDTLQSTGRATFSIDSDGRLTNAAFTPSTTAVIASNSRDLETVTTRQSGEEVLADSTTQTSVETLSTRVNQVEQDATTTRDSYANVSALQGEIALGGVLNFGNTPWTPAANTLRAELFLRDAIIGRSHRGSQAGWRAALAFFPFGEQQREAYQYSESGEAVPLYKTEPVLDESGNQQVEQLVAADGSVVTLPVNRFAVDDSGQRIAQTVGTGRANGPGLYVRLQDIWHSDGGVTVDGGVQFSF